MLMVGLGWMGFGMYMGLGRVEGQGLGVSVWRG